MRHAALLMLFLVSACGAPSSDSTASPSALPSEQATAEPTTSAPPTSALDMLECDGPPSEVGGEGPGLADRGGASPDAALGGFLSTTPFVIPRSGYEPLGQSGERHAYDYRADGDAKVVVVISPRFADMVGARYGADELRTCPEAEFGSAAEFNDERRVWTHESSGLILTDIPGPGHCGWESARMLHLEIDGVLASQYLRDPAGVFAGLELLETYDEGVDLPDDATFSGYRTDEGLELWFTESDRAAYVVTPDGVERWPRAREPIGCS